MRIVALSKWKPEKWPEVVKRFAEFLKGAKPEVLEADKRVNTIAYELGSAFGMSRSVWIAEGDPRDISTLLRYWMDLLEFDVFPTFDFDTIKKLYPDRHPHYE